jgi:restriction system protein
MMARGSGSSGSFRQLEAARQAEQRAREKAARLQEQQLKARERERAVQEAAGRDQEAADKTVIVEQRVAELEGLLRSSLSRDPSVSIDSLRRQVTLPPLDLGRLAAPLPAPEWAEFEPEPARGLRRMLGGQQRYDAAVELAGQAFRQAQEDYQRREAERLRQVADARRTYGLKLAEAERDVAANNSHIDELAAGLAGRDRFAVSEYVQIVLDRSPYPEDFPVERFSGYVPESSLIAVEWYLPPIDIVPEQKAFRHVKTRKSVEPAARPLSEIRMIYQSVIAQIALRTLREIFDSTLPDLISTVVFNGRVHAVDPLTGQKIQPHLITLRATREQLAPLVLTEPKFKPVECVRRYFFADVSPHPDELIPVEPVMPYSMADPRVVDPVDVISDIDKRPNLLDLTPKEFEAFIQNLFTRMGFDTKRSLVGSSLSRPSFIPAPFSRLMCVIFGERFNMRARPRGS